MFLLYMKLKREQGRKKRSYIPKKCSHEPKKCSHEPKKCSHEPKKCSHNVKNNAYLCGFRHPEICIKYYINIYK